MTEAPPPCEECEWYLTHTDGGQHAKALHAEIAELRALRDRLRDAILYTTELYAEPVRYKTSKGLKPNLSIGFETRYQEMYELAAALAPKGGT